MPCSERFDLTNYGHLVAHLYTKETVLTVIANTTTIALLRATVIGEADNDKP